MKKKITLDTLANSMKESFNNLTDQISNEFSKVNQEIEEIKTDVTGIRQTLSQMNKRMDLFAYKTDVEELRMEFKPYKKK